MPSAIFATRLDSSAPVGKAIEMRRTLRGLVLASVLATGGALGMGTASACPPTGYGVGGYGSNYSSTTYTTTTYTTAAYQAGGYNSYSPGYGGYGPVGP